MAPVVEMVRVIVMAIKQINQVEDQVKIGCLIPGIYRLMIQLIKEILTIDRYL